MPRSVFHDLRKETYGSVNCALCLSAKAHAKTSLNPHRMAHRKSFSGFDDDSECDFLIL